MLDKINQFLEDNAAEIFSMAIVLGYVVGCYIFYD